MPGLDAITGGGLPRARPTIICGAAGCGKTLLAMEFLLRGAIQYGEPGVFMAFEETADDLAANVRSLGFEVEKLVAKKQLLVDHVQLERSEIEETGEYDLEGLFIRLGSAIDAIGARRVVLDTLESLFTSFSNEAILRAELRRLFRWLKDREVTAVITAERGDGTLTRQGLEEYVSDCVILLDHRVIDQVATRRLRIVKYRGTSHGTNEYPFLIDDQGIEVLPITSAGLDYPVSAERISTGIDALDEMLGGKGLYRGSSVLISGTAGSGKTSLACQLTEAVCRREERVLYFAFEESRDQIIRNMASIGLELGPCIEKGLLRIEAARPTLLGIEAHLTRIQRSVRDFQPHLVVIDPVSNIVRAGNQASAEAMLTRLIDFFKAAQVTTVMTSLNTGGDAEEKTEVGISSVIDTWILVRDIESSGERNRGIYVLKSRGMAHANQIREFLLTSDGIKLREVYLGPEGMLTGSARVAQEARERAADAERRRATERERRQIERRRAELEAEIAARRTALEALAVEGGLERDDAEARDQSLARGRAEMARSRGRGSAPRPEKVDRPTGRRLKFRGKARQV